MSSKDNIKDIIASLPDNRLQGLIVAHRNRGGWCCNVRYQGRLLPFQWLCQEWQRRKGDKK